MSNKQKPIRSKSAPPSRSQEKDKESIAIQVAEPTVVEPKIWKSCCLTQDSNAVRFYSRIVITVMIIAFCMYQLIVLENCEAQSLYSGILMACVGIWFPSPATYGSSSKQEEK